MLRYPATLRRDGKTFVVLFPDLPFAHTNGDSREGALSHASDALHTALSMLMEKNPDIPDPGKLRRGAVLVGLGSVTADAKVALYKELRSRGVRKADLARRMGIHKQQIDRLLDIDHASRIEQLESASVALQMRLTVSIQSVADLAV